MYSTSSMLVAGKGAMNKASLSLEAWSRESSGKEGIGQKITQVYTRNVW